MKTTLQGINSRVDEAEDQISDFGRERSRKQRNRKEKKSKKTKIV